MAEQKKKKLNIELPDEIAEGVYTNLAVISHSPSEFILDFIRLVPNVPKARVKSRVVVSPQNAKRLLKALNDNIQRYEAQFGRIEDKHEPPVPPMSFNTPKGQA